jgi:pyrroline-5-carboxylate reductase
MAMDKSKNKKIAIIGVGRMGRALLKGFEASGMSSEDISSSDDSETNRKAVEAADWVFIAVIPTLAKKVIGEIGDLLANKLVLSVIVPLNEGLIQTYSGNSKQKIIRLTPNIPVSVNQGVIGFFANKYVNDSEKALVASFLSKLGLVIKVNKEEDLDTIALIGSCGPAVVATVIQSLAKYGANNGLSSQDAESIANKALTGTLRYLEETNDTLQSVIQSVATKGGITEAVLNSLKDDGLDEEVKKALESGKKKITQ